VAEIVVVGDVIDDVLAVTQGPIREDTDTLANIAVRPGGSAANTACWIGYRGHPVTFHGRVGARDIDRHLAEFARYGVTAELQPDSEHPTGTIVVIVRGETRTMLSDRGANLTLDVSDFYLNPEYLPKVLHLTGYSFFHRERIDDLIALMDRTAAHGGQVLLDCSSAGFLADHGAQWWWDIASHATVVKGNADEAEFLTGLPAHDSLQEMASHGPRAIVTLAGDGAGWCESGGTPSLMPARPLGPHGMVDPTGAGDAFSAGVLTALHDGGSLEDCVTQGLDFSAEAISQRGARPLLPQTH
jgi:sugar/nucleoside kinase (ribokinase family)